MQKTDVVVQCCSETQYGRPETWQTGRELMTPLSARVCETTRESAIPADSQNMRAAKVIFVPILFQITFGNVPVLRRFLQEWHYRTL